MCIDRVSINPLLKFGKIPKEMDWRTNYLNSSIENASPIEIFTAAKFTPSIIVIPCCSFIMLSMTGQQLRRVQLGIPWEPRKPRPHVYLLLRTMGYSSSLKTSDNCHSRDGDGIPAFRPSSKSSLDIFPPRSTPIEEGRARYGLIFRGGTQLL